jgi:hypothetical protein
MADNFILPERSKIDRFSFIGVRTGTEIPPDLNFTTSIDWRIYSFDPNWDNTGKDSDFGSLVSFGNNQLTSREILGSYSVSIGWRRYSWTNIQFTVNIPDLVLGPGQYWLALHANVSGWSGTIGSGDDTSLYWAESKGDGIWGWSSIIWGDGTPGKWRNPGTSLTIGGLAFSIYGEPVPVPITINIRPWGDLNRINLRNHGTVRVAILSTDDFNAPSQVDQDFLTFGATGDEQSLAFCNRRPKDVNQDGLRDDLVCQFYIDETGFQCGDTEGVLKGKTKSGTPIQGSDSVKIIPCKK